MAYHKTCLRCGGGLFPNVAGPEVPPWRCDECHKSYFVGQLSQEARMGYRKPQHDFGWPGTALHVSVQEAVRIEVEAAHVRGVSLRSDQVDLVQKSDIKALMKRHAVSPAFKKTLQAK